MTVSKYTFSEYSEDWSERFRLASDEWRLLLGESLLEIQHIGSTSVPGLAAKPIIDMLPVVRSLSEVDALSESIVHAGFRAWGEYGISGRRYFTRDRDGVRQLNIHLFETGNPEVERHLAFCAYLRHHPEVCLEYEKLKRAVYREHPADIAAYNDGKNDWIKNLEPIAVDWFRRSNRKTKT